MENQKPVPEEEEKYVAPLMDKSFYLGHIYIIVYICIGAGIQIYDFYSLGTYRLLSVATWPWVITSQSFLLLISVILYFTALLAIARSMRKKLAELEINWFTILPYGFYVFVWLAMLGRLLAYYISPEGIFFGQ